MYQDDRGLELTTGSDEAAKAFNAAMAEYFAYGKNVNDHIKAAVAADPDFCMAYVVRGYLMMGFSNAALIPAAKKFLAAAQEHAAHSTPREQKHIAVLDAWTHGDIDRANAGLEEIVKAHPHDLFAARTAHFNYFWLGDRENLKGIAERILPAWSESVPGYSLVLGMHAFGLEECGDYRPAEKTGRRAVALNPADYWATHAVAHVMEMEGRHHDGIAWLDGLKSHWEGANNFINHLWWHRAMYHWELEQFDRVLDLYDHHFRKEPSDFYLDIQNAVSMLWRLELSGLDVGARWEELAEKSRGHLNDLQLPFSDMHYLMALLRVGDREGAHKIVHSMREFSAGKATYAPVVKDVSLPVAEAITAFTEGRYGDAVDRLVPVQAQLHRAGGSHAQRDVVTLTLIESAIRGKRNDLAKRLLADRTAARPTSPGSWQTYARVLDEVRDAAGAQQARAKAESLLKAS